MPFFLLLLTLVHALNSGRFKMTEQKIGRGAFGVIHIGVDSNSGCNVAVKVLRMDSRAQVVFLQILSSHLGLVCVLESNDAPCTPTCM